MSDRAEKDKAESTGAAGTLQDELEMVQGGFLWLSTAVGNKLEQLRRHVTTPDQPTWNEKAADGLLNVALEVGAAMTGQWIAAKVTNSVVASLGDDTDREAVKKAQETAKSLFEKGIKHGFSAGKSLMASTPSVEASHRFVDGQKTGVAASLQDSQSHFIRVTRHQLTSRAEANALAKACEQKNLSKAAEFQYAASRDAYVAFLAQSKYGTVRAAPGAAATTNLANQETRDKANAGTGPMIPFYSPERVAPPKAPEANDAVSGKAPGILTVVADLPLIVRGQQAGKPSVSVAILNDVPRAVASQYEGKSLAELRIPRLVRARVIPVDGFVLNIDEAGTLQASDNKGRAWLRANGERLGGANDEKSEQAIQRGLADLLEALHIDSIKKSGAPQ
jgi:hypothetical protein